MVNKNKLLCTEEVITQLVLAQLILVLGSSVRRQGLSCGLSNNICHPFHLSHPWKIMYLGVTVLSHASFPLWNIFSGVAEIQYMNWLLYY